jgi:peroxiredoxin
MRYTTLFALLGLGLSTFASAQTVTLKIVSEGAAQRLRDTRPQQMKVTDEPPRNVTKIPGGITAPLFGVLTLGPTEKPTTIAIVIDEPEGKPARLFADANANGDLTDDPPAEWKPLPYRGSDGKEYADYRGGVTVQIRYGEETIPLRLNLHRSDKNDPARAFSRQSLLYTPDYAREGELKLGGKTYKIMLAETIVTGDFRGRTYSPTSGILLLIDRNDNGKFDVRGESYDTAQPFNIGGVSYELTNVAPSGASFVVRRSVRAVAEIPPPPDLRPGKKAPPFQAKTLTNATVRFPDIYKGKLVLLTFWASWCGDCQGELSYLTKAYEIYQDKGLEILGVSLDKPNAPLTSFLKEHKMGWPQIYDGRYWQTELAQKYLITSIPTTFLIDGDTGEILATGDSVTNMALLQTLAEALNKKFPGFKAQGL